MATKKEWIDAIVKVLSESNEALNYKDIAGQISSDNLIKDVGSRPGNLVNLYINESLRNEGSGSPFYREERGVFTLKEKASDVSIDAFDEDELAVSIITSFGMYWSRDEVKWESKLKILGMESVGARPVDFYDQRGIYLLYDGRQVIYVGRTTDQALGKRLLQHTVDRHKTRWDRFSWFGLRPVSDKGALGELPNSYSNDKIIATLEAILIEALETPQNRKKGDDLGKVEYIQNRSAP